MSMALTADNYYTAEANQRYMSHSLYKKFITCEASAMAELLGEWEEPQSEAMLVGSYVHAALDGTIEKFKESHPEMFTQKGELKASFKLADKMIETLLTDTMIAEHLTGEHEEIITAELFGCPWKAKLDVRNTTHRRIADVKTVRSLLHKEWSVMDNKYLLWIEYYGYVRQMAIYTEILRRAMNETEPYTPFLVAVTKEEPPDKAILGFHPEDLEAELALVEWNMPRVISVWQGQQEPRRCERCDYCKQTKKITDVMYFRELVI